MRRGKGKEKESRKDTERLLVLSLPLSTAAHKPGCSEREESGE